MVQKQNRAKTKQNRGQGTPVTLIVFSPVDSEICQLAPGYRDLGIPTTGSLNAYNHYGTPGTRAPGHWHSGRLGCCSCSLLCMPKKSPRCDQSP
eukprot:2825244-Rhodomonas_salina.1